MRILLLAILFVYAIKSQEPITVNLTKVYNDGMKILDENGNFIPNPDYVYDHSKQRELASTYSSSITNQAQLSYYGPLYFFNNAGSTSSSASINILMDTGSSWLWACSSAGSGCQSSTTLSSSLFFSSSAVSSSSCSYCTDSGTKSITYGSGSVSGNIKYTRVGITSSSSSATYLKTIEVTSNSLTVGTTSWSGIIGLLPSSSSGSDLFVDKLFNNGVIPANAFGVYYTDSSSGSTITFGGFDTSRVSSVSLFTFTSLSDTTYWKVGLRTIKYGNILLDNYATNAVLDTGTSLLLWPTANFNSFKSQLSSKSCGTLSSGYYACQCSSTSDFSSLYFLFNNYEYEISPSQYATTTYISGKLYCYFYISTATSYVYLGDTFFRNYYVYHDVTNKRVGMYGTYMKYYESAPSNYTWIIVGACIAFVAIVIGICVFCCVCRAKSSGGASSTGKYSSAPPRRGAAPPPETVIF